MNDGHMRPGAIVRRLFNNIKKVLDWGGTWCFINGWFSLIGAGKAQVK